jgi:hypothetical protein
MVTLDGTDPLLDHRPETQTLEAYAEGRRPRHPQGALQLEAGRWVFVGRFSQQEKARAEPFAAVEIELALLWPSPPPPQTKELTTQARRGPRSAARCARARQRSG